MKRLVPNPVMRALAFILGAIGWGFYLVVNAVAEWCSETKRLVKDQWHSSALPETSSQPPAVSRPKT